jgi:lysozyme family protein
MGQTTTQQRRNWKEYECHPGKLREIAFGPAEIEVVPITIEAWNALACVLRHHGYQVRHADTSSYNCREITAGHGRSLHSFGIAVDVNAQTNPFKFTKDGRALEFSSKSTQSERAKDVRLGRADTDMTPEMIRDVLAIKTKNGQRAFEWGGNWKDRKDAMHFEIDIKPADLKDGINWSTVVGADGVPQGEIAWSEEQHGPDHVGAYVGEMGSFEKCYPLAVKWEDQGLHDPDEPREPNNMGITLEDLSHYRGREATVEELAGLDREDAKRISHDLHWRPINGEQLPLSAAAQCYHSAVLTGPGRSGQALQEALNRQGHALKIDGVVGPLTIEACANADLRRLADDFAEIQDEYLKGLPGFPKYGNSWLEQIADIRNIAEAAIGATTPVILEHGIPGREEVSTMATPDVLRVLIDALLRAQPTPKPVEPRTDQISNDPLLQVLMAALTGRTAVPPAATGDASKPTSPPTAPVLTPIDKMFPASEFFAGKKTAISVIAYVILMILQYTNQVGTAVFDVTAVGDHTVTPSATGGILTALIGGLGGLGLLSKFDRVNVLLAMIAGKKPIL